MTFFRVFAAIALLMVLLAGWFVASHPASASTINLFPAADATVSQSQPTTSLGTATTLHVDGSPVEAFYIRFDVPPLDGAVSRATLTLSVVNSSRQGGDVYKVSNTSWDESITWNSRPTVDGSMVTSVGQAQSGSIVSVDITSAVTGSGALSLAITSSYSDAAYYSSRESSNPPRLTIETSASPTPTSSPSPSSTSTPSPTSTPSSTPTPPSSSGHVTLNPVADASVNESQPTISFGSRTTLEVDGSPVKDVYLRFDVPQLPGNVSRVTLSLQVVDSSNSGGEINTVSNSSWGESITWNSRPSIDGSRVASIGAVSSGSKVTVDVTSAVKGSGSLSLALTSTSSNGADYGSRESTTPPTLTIETGSGTPVPTPTPSPTPSPTSTPNPTMTPPTATGPVTLNPVADASVYESQPTTSYGSQATLEVDGSPVKEFYLRFSVPQLGGTVSHATLTMTIVNSSNLGGNVYSVSNTGWNESITWNSRPSIDGPQVASIGAVHSGSSVTVDVTSAVKGAGSLSLAVTSTSTDGADYSSRESTNPPALTIETGTGIPVPTPSPAPSPTPTPTPLPSGDHATVIFGSDIAYEGTTTGDDKTAVLVQQLLAKYPGAIVQTAGDNVQGDGSMDEYTDWYDPSWGAFLNRTYAAIGNHDYASSGHNYAAYFGARGGPIDKYYYSYDVAGHWHIIVLNSNSNFNQQAVGTAQYQWLQQDLIANQGKNVIAVWHHPLYSSGGWGNQTRMADMFRLLDQYQAEIVVSGHDHIYERYLPQDADGHYRVDGVVQFLVGTAGQPTGVANLNPNSEVLIGHTLGVTVMFLYPDHYEWQFVTLDGTILDAGSAPVIP